jgi:hypothetical protein
MLDMQNELQRELEAHAPNAVVTQDWALYFHIYTDAVRSCAASQCIPADQIDDIVQAVWADFGTRLRQSGPQHAVQAR